MDFLTDIERSKSPAKVAQGNFEELERRITGLEFPFLSASVITCAHNLGYRPGTVTAVVGDKEQEGEVEHVDDNTCIVRFNGNYSGTIIVK